MTRESSPTKLRVRQPTEVLEARGSLRKLPKKYADRLASVDVNLTPFGDPPEDFEDDEIRIWREFENTMPFGSLSGSDRSMYELFVKLMAEQRRNWAGFSIKKLQALVQIQARFGMSPTDRSRIISNTALKPKEDEFDFG